MKKIVFACLISLCFIGLNAQNKNPYKAYSDSLGRLKKQGKLSGEEWFYNPNATKGLHISKPNPSKKGARLSNSNNVMSTSCNCWIPRDTSFRYVPFNGSGGSGGPGVAPMYANDDWSTAGITLPFNFCFYGSPAGTSTNQLYINNNGNVSFGAPYSIFSAVPFPSSAYVMIAPFWGDVQTDQTGSGFVYYSLTPTHLIVQWDSVYYYGEEGNNTLINTFQLIITDGIDPILPVGNNISFCYGEMQWTTGYASGGSLGFGGTAATVGLNKGDGVNYTEIGLFNQSGSAYTGPSWSPPGGVGYLAGTSYYFNSCGTGGSLAPVVTSGGPPSACVGDTLTICGTGNVLVHTVSFIPPSSTGSVSATATSSGLGSNFSITSSTSGASASLTFQVNSTGLASGYYTVTVTATNNASLTTTLDYIIHVVNGTSFPAPAIVVSPSVTCGSTPAVVTLTNSSSYTSWVWSTGATTPSITVATTSTVQVTVEQGGCTSTGSVVVQFYSVPNPTLGGALTYCTPTSTSTAIYVNQPVSGGTSPYSYSWNPSSASTYSINAIAGTYTVVVTDIHGCKDSVSTTVTANSITPLSITAGGNLCATPGTGTLFSSITTATSYTWSPLGGTGSSTPTYTVGSTPGLYTLALTINNCTVAATYSLSPPAPPVLAVTGNTVICAGTKTTLTVVATPTASAGYTYAWYNGATPIGSTDTLTFNATGSAYFVTAVNNNTQCKGVQTFTILPAANPTVSIAPKSPTYCKGHGDSLIAVVSGGAPGYTYSWTPGGLTSDTIVPIPPANVTSITYSLTVTDSKGCKASTFQNIKEGILHLTVPNQYICPGVVASFHAHGSSGTNPVTYVWLPSMTSGATYTTSVPGTYSVVMTDVVFGCKDTVPVNVIQYPKPVANFTYTPSPATQGSPVIFTDNSTIASPDSVKWDMWIFGDGDTVIANPNPTHTYANGGTYTLTLIVATEFGCLDTIYPIINVQYNVIAPNIITPNGDGINEYLAFKNLQYFNNNKLWIYNRWGTQLYQNNDYKNDWTGKDYSDGTYFYILDIPDKNQTLKGFFESIK